MNNLMKNAFLLCLAFLALPFIVSGSEERLAIGTTAPDFTLPYATKDEIVWDGISLSEMVGESIIVLAFYPANWSGGCTAQLCMYRDNFSALQDLNATILAISGDYVFSHHEWAKQENFPFKLLSDHFHEVGKLYDSYNAERGFNRRTVFIIDRQGKIAYKDMNYSVSDENDYLALKQALEKLQ
jgi:peroxiredoxin